MNCRTDDTCTCGQKKKNRKANNDPQSTTQKTKYSSTQNRRIGNKLQYKSCLNGNNFKQ